MASLAVSKMGGSFFPTTTNHRMPQRSFMRGQVHSRVGKRYRACGRKDIISGSKVTRGFFLRRNLFGRGALALGMIEFVLCLKIRKSLKAKPSRLDQLFYRIMATENALQFYARKPERRVRLKKSGGPNWTAACVTFRRLPARTTPHSII